MRIVDIPLRFARCQLVLADVATLVDAGGAGDTRSVLAVIAEEATLPLPGTPDVVMYDRDLGRLYVAVGSPGTVSVFDTRSRQEVETIQTEEGAHTIGWDPASRRLFVFEPKSCGVAIFEDAA